MLLNKKKKKKGKTELGRKVEKRREWPLIDRDELW